jgi:hypothetical protein
MPDFGNMENTVSRVMSLNKKGEIRRQWEGPKKKKGWIEILPRVKSNIL